MTRPREPMAISHVLLFNSLFLRDVEGINNTARVMRRFDFIFDFSQQDAGLAVSYREYPMGHQIVPDELADLTHWL